MLASLPPLPASMRPSSISPCNLHGRPRPTGWPTSVGSALSHNKCKCSGEITPVRRKCDKTLLTIRKPQSSERCKTARKESLRPDPVDVEFIAILFEPEDSTSCKSKKSVRFSEAVAIYEVSMDEDSVNARVAEDPNSACKDGDIMLNEQFNDVIRSSIPTRVQLWRSSIGSMWTNVFGGSHSNCEAC